MALAELLQLGMAGAADWAKNLASGIIPAVCVYSITKRDVKLAKEQATTAREEARREVAEALKPALNAFKYEVKDEILRGMNGTYLRTAEAKIHFDNLKDAIARIEKAVVRPSHDAS